VKKFGITSGVVIALFSPGLAVAEPSALLKQAREHFAPLPAVPAAKDPVSVARVELGRRLFFENRASADGNIGCFFCHQADKGGADGLAKAVGVNGKVNARNAPSIFNAALNFKQHWRGDRESLEDQAEKSLLGPATFGNTDIAVPIGKLKAIPGYATAFAKAFPDDKDAVTQKNWGAAIAAYERTLLTPSKFDAFLAGDEKALSKAEQAGLAKFIEHGCNGCHDGAGVGGSSFSKFEAAEALAKEAGVAQPDKGRADVTKNDADLYVFKVPSLRNVAQSGPYFHDGSVADLGKAVKIMGKSQLGKDLPDDDVKAIVAFLGALSGPAPANFSAPEPFPDAPAKP